MIQMQTVSNEELLQLEGGWWIFCINYEAVEAQMVAYEASLW
jgi:hypothetical protein